MQQTIRKIQCRCGYLQGSLSGAAGVTPLSCHCRDCQAYAHALGHPERVLHELGGTDVVTTLQQHLSFTKGKLLWHAFPCLNKAPCAGTQAAATHL
ncbi:DUF6151 family protein [Telluria aromaticivorans]|uniref:DUF6151 family protein n=1 Tax=Telluria aromaticivorans TaxID=2725995 RepID=UPI0035312B08